MADIRISELSELQNVEDEDVLIINDTSAQTTKRITRERFLVGTTQNVYDSGDNAVAKQDLTVNNDLFVGGNFSTTGEVEFGSLRDAISGVTAYKFSTKSDPIQNNDSDGSLPTSGAVVSYLNYFLDNLYDSATIPTTVNDLIDVQITSPVENQVLTYNGSQWVNEAPAASLIYDLGDLDNVVIAGPSEGQVLKYINGFWVNAADSGQVTSLSQLPDASTAGLEVDAIAEQASTKLVISPFGTAAYRFDQYGDANNPTIHVKAGTTIAFDLDSTTSHPFLITKDATNYNVGLIHVADNGTVSTGSSAQAKNSGTLYWKVPSDVVGSFGYLCSLYSAMNGTIEVSPVDTGLSARSNLNATTATIAPSDSADVTIAGYKSYALLNIEADRDCWVRVYTDETSRTADVGRTQGASVAEGSGVVADLVLSAGNRLNLAPATIGFNNSSPVSTNIPIKIVNLSGSSSAIGLTLTALRLEA